MSLAAYLGLIGNEYVRMEIEGDSCYWVFNETDDLADEVLTFLEGKAQVEPNQFNARFAALKRDMFAFARSHGSTLSRRS
jgi:hypothetical protein